jgi:hypothetical protein
VYEGNDDYNYPDWYYPIGTFEIDIGLENYSVYTRIFPKLTEV